MTIKFEKNEMQDISGIKGLSLIDIPQRTPKWFAARRFFLTASEAPELLISFINKESFMRNNRADFAKYKLGIKEKEFGDFQQRLMERGKLNEPIAVNEIEKMLNKFNKENPENIMHMWTEPVFVKDNWALASTDCVLYQGDFKNLKLIAPVEIKYTETRNTFNKYLEFNHYNFYQLAFQMYVTGTKVGYLVVTLNEFGKDMETVMVSIDSDSKYYKEVIGSIKELKKIHKTICIEKKNPYANQEASAILSALTLFHQEILSDRVSKDIKNILEDAFEAKIKLNSLDEKIKNIKNELIFKMIEAGSYSCKLTNEETQYILCSKDESHFIMKRPLLSRRE